MKRSEAIKLINFLDEYQAKLIIQEKLEKEQEEKNKLLFDKKQIDYSWMKQTKLEQRKIKQKEYREANKEKHKEYMKQYQKDNREYLNNYFKEYKLKNGK